MNIQLQVLKERPNEGEPFVFMDSLDGELPENLRIEYLLDITDIGVYNKSPNKCCLAKSGLYYAIENCWKVIITKN